MWAPVEAQQGWRPALDLASRACRRCKAPAAPPALACGRSSGGSAVEYRCGSRWNVQDGLQERGLWRQPSVGFQTSATGMCAVLRPARTLLSRAGGRTVKLQARAPRRQQCLHLQAWAAGWAVAGALAGRKRPPLVVSPPCCAPPSAPPLVLPPPQSCRPLLLRAPVCSRRQPVVKGSVGELLVAAMNSSALHRLYPGGPPPAWMRCWPPSSPAPAASSAA